MILLAHIIIAFTSLLVAGYAWFAPSRHTMRLSYVMVALTLISGTYLVWTAPAHLAQACTSGLIYLGLVFGALAAARHKLASRHE
jgi:hypothetical protein